MSEDPRRSSAPSGSRRPPLLSMTLRQELAGRLSTWQTIDRRAVHKAAVAEVLITDITTLGPHLAVVAAQWSRGHPTFRPDQQGRPHPLAFVETVRQASMYLAHRHYGVPPGGHFIFDHVTASFEDASGVTTPHGPAGVLLALQTAVTQVGDRVTGAVLEAEAWYQDQRIATAHASYRCLSSGAYVRVRRAVREDLRTASARHRVRPNASGSPFEEGVSRVDVDLQHPTFFDHPVDHLPGMLLLHETLEAARRRLPEPAARLEECTITFDRFAELDQVAVLLTRPTRCPSGQERVDVAVDQLGTVVARTSATFARSA